MRIGFVTHYHTLYGANRSLLNLVEGLQGLGVTAHVVVPRPGPLTEELQRLAVPYVEAPLACWVAEGGETGGRWRRLQQNFKLLPRLTRQFVEWQIDLVYTNSSVTPLGALLARRLKIPHVWHLREFCDLHYGFGFDFGRALTYALVRRADAQVAISRALADHITAGRNWPRLQVVNNGVLARSEFAALYRSAHAAPVHADKFLFAIVGRIYPAKGQAEAVRALAQLADEFPQARLLIVGEGDTEYLARLADELGIADRVRFLGYVSDPYQVYRQADALLMCSRYEAMGRVTVEAMSACLPVIGYDQAGTSELIDHEQTGLLYRGGPEELAAGMRRFLEKPEWAEQMGRNGWAVARSNFCIEDYAERIHNVLVNLTPQKASP